MSRSIAGSRSAGRRRRDESQGVHRGPWSRPGRRGAAGADQHDVLDRLGARQLVAQQLQPLGRRHQHPHGAVAEDVRDLLGRSNGLTGTNTPPAAEVPKIAATVSIRLSR